MTNVVVIRKVRDFPGVITGAEPLIGLPKELEDGDAVAAKINIRCTAASKGTIVDREWWQGCRCPCLKPRSAFDGVHAAEAWRPVCGWSPNSDFKMFFLCSCSPSPNDGLLLGHHRMGKTVRRRFVAYPLPKDSRPLKHPARGTQPESTPLIGFHKAEIERSSAAST